MKMETLKLLQKLQRKFGVRGRPSGPFGKIVQKLLAVSLHEIGFTNIVERGVQGVDIDITGTPSLSSDKVDALRDRTKDGYSSVIAVLRLAPLEDWIFAKIPVDEVPAGAVLIESLRRYRMKDLENRLSAIFDKIVQKHSDGIMKKGEQYLKEQLRQAGITARED